jgi:hypothetical protein
MPNCDPSSPHNPSIVQHGPIIMPLTVVPGHRGSGTGGAMQAPPPGGEMPQVLLAGSAQQAVGSCLLSDAGRSPNIASYSEVHVCDPHMTGAVPPPAPPGPEAAVAPAATLGVVIVAHDLSPVQPIIAEVIRTIANHLLVFIAPRLVRTLTDAYE